MVAIRTIPNRIRMLIVSIQEIKVLTHPVAEVVPVTSITATDQFVGAVTWEPSVTRFAYSAYYSAKVKLTANTSYMFTGLPANHFTVAGATSVSFDSATEIVTVKLPKTADPADVNQHFKIEGLSPPIAGATPVNSITVTEQFTETLTSWSPTVANTFAYSQEYAVKVKMTAKYGFMFTGVGTNHFTVYGTTSVSFNAATAELTSVFPKTADAAANPVSIKEIFRVTVPIAGSVPLTTITKNAQFS